MLSGERLVALDAGEGTVLLLFQRGLSEEPVRLPGGVVPAHEIMPPFDFQLRTRVVVGDGAFARLGELARELSFSRTLIVADPGIVATGQVRRAADSLWAAGIDAHVFHDFDANPDSDMVE